MAELFEKKQPKAATPLKPVSVATGGDGPTGVDETVANINKALGKVKIMHGAKSVEYDVAGKTVDYVRNALATVLNIDAAARALIDSKTVQDEKAVVLEAGTILEFIKTSGTKG